MKYSLLILASALFAQDVRPIGVIQSVDAAAKKVEIKTDGGPSLNIRLSDATGIVKIKPGERDLKNATPLQLADLSAGDRILARGAFAEGNTAFDATQIIVMGKAELASKQAAEQSAWNRGVFGTVKSVDAAQNRIDVEVRTGIPGAAAKPMSVNVAEATIFRRYAPDSVRFSDAIPSKLSEIKAGDQVRARGEKSADGNSLAAQEVVAGTFRNIAATVVSVDVNTNTLTVTDLDAKKPVTVKLSADSSVRRMPEMMSRFLAMRLNADAAGAQGNPMPARPSGTGTPAGGPARPGGGMGPGAGMGPGGGMGGPPNPAQMMERMPAINLTELKTGDALIIASTEGRKSGEVTAITVLAGVEAILTAPSRNRQSVLGSWNLDTGMSMGMGMQ